MTTAEVHFEHERRKYPSSDLIAEYQVGREFRGYKYR
jgi:hypothetical protein